MQKLYKLFSCCLLLVALLSTSGKLFATNIIVLVGGSDGMSFVPSNASIAVGDTITWQYDNGYHTTTSAAIPAGADPWDAPMYSPGDTYSYVPTVAGIYNYVCTFHQSMGMIGSFTVSPSHSNHLVLVGGSDGMSFVPATLSISLGDTITWQYDNGYHTTTSAAIPPGADPWDAPMYSSGDTYSYVPTVAGTYNYVCTFHQSMGMIASFTVSSSSSNHLVLVGGSDGMSFVPAALSIPLGDTVTWLYDNGYHTTTSSNIPPGAAPWDMLMANPGDMYSYVPTVTGNYDYVCVFHQSMGMIASFTITTPLPLKITSFTVAGCDSGASLNWTTAAAKDLTQFNIERSSNGNDFKSITTIGANANKQNYSFTDKNWSTGKNYYRIKSLNTNGTFDYTKVISVENKQTILPVSIVVNPVTRTLTLKIVDLKNNIKFKVIDLGGKEWISKNMKAGFNGLLNLNVGDIPAGQYILQVSGLESNLTMKFVKE